MKKTTWMILCICLLALLCSGCQSADTLGADDGGAFQLLYNRSESAKEFAQSAFQGIMGDCTIQETSYGFVAEEIPVCLVGFTYEKEGSSGCYGYKIAVFEDGSFQILEEGPGLGELIFL